MFLFSSRSHQKGFTIVEMSLVLILLGITIGAATAIIDGIIKTSEVAITKHRMEKIEEKFIEYISKYGYLPCPIKADGSEMSDDECRVGSSTSSIMQLGGKVPFDKIGLTEKDVKDGWGQKINYRIAPYFTQPVDSSDADAVDKACIWNWDRKDTAYAPAEENREYRPFDFRCFNDARTGDFDSNRDYQTTLEGKGLLLHNQMPCNDDYCKISLGSISSTRPMVPYVLYSPGDPNIRHKRVSHLADNLSTMEIPNGPKYGIIKTTVLTEDGYASNDTGTMMSNPYAFINAPINHNGGSSSYFGFIFKYTPMVQLAQEAGLDSYNSSYSTGDLDTFGNPLETDDDSTGDTGTDDIDDDDDISDNGDITEKTKIIEISDSSNDETVVVSDDDEGDSLFVNSNGTAYNKAFWLTKPYQLQTEISSLAVGLDHYGKVADFNYHKFDVRGYVRQTYIDGSTGSTNPPIAKTTPQMIKDYLDTLQYSNTISAGYGPNGFKLTDTLYEGLGLPLNYHNGLLSNTPTVTYRCRKDSNDLGPVRYDTSTDEYYCKYNTSKVACEIDDDDTTCYKYNISLEDDGVTRRGHKFRASVAFAIEENSKFSGLALAFVPYMGLGDPRKAPSSDNGDMASTLVGSTPLGYHKLWTSSKLINPSIAKYAKNAGFYGHVADVSTYNEEYKDITRMQRKFGVGVFTPKNNKTKFKILKWVENDGTEFPTNMKSLAWAHHSGGGGSFPTWGYNPSRWNYLFMKKPSNGVWYIVGKEKSFSSYHRGRIYHKNSYSLLGSFDHTNKTYYNAARSQIVGKLISGTPTPPWDPSLYHNDTFINSILDDTASATYDSPTIAGTTNNYPADLYKYDAACPTGAPSGAITNGCYESSTNNWLKNTHEDAWKNETTSNCTENDCQSSEAAYEMAQCRNCMDVYGENIGALSSCYSECADIKVCIEECPTPSKVKKFHKMIVHVYANPNDPVPFEQNDCHDNTYSPSSGEPEIHRVRVKAWLWEYGDCQDSASDSCVNIGDSDYIFKDTYGNTNDQIGRFTINGSPKYLKSSISNADLLRAKEISACVEVPATWMNIGLTMASKSGGSSLSEVRFNVNWIPSPKNPSELLVDTVSSP